MTKTASLITSPYENLKGFAMSRPPVIIFMVCIALISVILMTLAFIVKDNELKKPDVSQVITLCYVTYDVVIFTHSNSKVTVMQVLMNVCSIDEKSRQLATEGCQSQ